MIRTKIIRSIAIIITFCFLLSFTLPLALVSRVEASNGAPVYSAIEMAEKAVKFIHDKYLAGERIDGYTAFVLTLAGEDLTAAKWNSNGETVRGEIENLADLLGNNNSLIDYITATQNPNGSFGPYSNEYGTKAPLQALAAVQGDIMDTNKVQAVITGAVNYFNTGYSNGDLTYEVSGWGFDYRCVEALAKAGEDLSVDKWVYDGKTLKEVVIASAHNTADSISADSLTKDAVYLAKELTVLHAVYPASDNIGVLAGAVAGKQNPDGSFGTSIYDHVLILAAMGKTDNIGSIIQDAAVGYIDSLKQEHQNSWGDNAGAAWGYASGVKEPDLTAQVITALSYMDGVNTPDSKVYNLVQEGLAYLADIQDVDTAAIPAQWDATFATAETLIALKSLGMLYNDYAGSESTWVNKSRTKTIAQCLLVLGKWNDENRRDRLVDLLAARQKQADPGRGSFENSVYSDMWAYLALGEAGKLGEFNAADVKEYILSKQSGNGSWGETFGSDYYPDFLSTTQAVRALTYLTDAPTDNEIKVAIENGLTYLKGLQQNDGGVYDPWDDPAVDNSEVIITLHKLGRDPKGSEWTITVGGQELNPVSYLMNKTMNDHGSFGTSRNIFGATEALYAYLYEIGENGGGGGGGSGGGGGITPDANEYSVNIAVVGNNGALLFGPGTVVVSKTGKWGLTTLGALHATGLNYTDDGGFVKSIAGQANSGMSGWMYKVNNTVPSSLASDHRVNQGDRVIWWYSTDPNSSGPTWDSLGGVNPGQGTPVATEDVIKGATELQSKIIDGSLKPSEAVDEINKLMSRIKNDLASPSMKAADASKTLRFIMDNTLSALINSSNATPAQAVAALRSIVNEGIKTVLARSDAGEVAEELKNSLATLVGSIITKAGTIPASQMEVSSTSTTTTLNLTAGMLKQRLEQVGQVQKELLDILSGDQLTDVALLARAPIQNLVVDLTGLAEQKETIELKIVDDTARNLRDSGLKLAVMIDDGFTITLSGKERAGRPANAATSPVMLAARGDRLHLLTFQNETESIAAEGYMLSVSRLEAAKATRLVQDAKEHSTPLVTLRPVGKAYAVAIKDLDNKNVTTLAEPLEFKLSYRGLTKNPELTGIYRYQDGKFVFAGAKADRLNELISAGVNTGGTFTLLEYDKRFSDLAGHWAEEDIRRLSAKHIVGGMSESSFGPGQAATRAQCAALLVRALNLPESKAALAFTDVHESAWYTGDVAAAARAGIIKGTAAGAFSPDKHITRAELAVMISRIIEGEQGLKEPEANKVLAEYTDAGKIPAWARAGMALAAETGIIRGRTAETIVPEGIINRAEVAVIIGRLLEEIDK